MSQMALIAHRPNFFCPMVIITGLLCSYSQLLVICIKQISAVYNVSFDALRCHRRAILTLAVMRQNYVAQ